MNKGEINELTEELKNIKAEMNVLKYTVNSLNHIKEEGKVIKNMIRSLTDGIEQIKVESIKIF